MSLPTRDHLHDDEKRRRYFEDLVRQGLMNTANFRLPKADYQAIIDLVHGHWADASIEAVKVVLRPHRLPLPDND